MCRLAVAIGLAAFRGGGSASELISPPGTNDWQILTLSLSTHFTPSRVFLYVTLLLWRPRPKSIECAHWTAVEMRRILGR